MTSNPSLSPLPPSTLLSNLSSSLDSERSTLLLTLSTLFSSSSIRHLERDGVLLSSLSVSSHRLTSSGKGCVTLVRSGWRGGGKGGDGEEFPACKISNREAVEMGIKKGEGGGGEVVRRGIVENITSKSITIQYSENNNNNNDNVTNNTSSSSSPSHDEDDNNGGGPSRLIWESSNIFVRKVDNPIIYNREKESLKWMEKEISHGGNRGEKSDLVKILYAEKDERYNENNNKIDEKDPSDSLSSFSIPSPRSPLTLFPPSLSSKLLSLLQLSSFNLYQSHAILSSLLTPDIHLLWGPPGTAKTTTLSAVIPLLYQMGYKVMVCGGSNNAVDNILDRTLEMVKGKGGMRIPEIRMNKGYKTWEEKYSIVENKTNEKEDTSDTHDTNTTTPIIPLSHFIRLGHPARVTNNLQSYSLEYRVFHHEQSKIVREIQREVEEKKRALYSKQSYSHKDKDTKDNDSWPKRKADLKRDLNSLRDDMRNRGRDARKDILSSSRLIFSTTSNIGGREFHEACTEKSPIDYLIIDEAAQITEPNALVAIVECLKYNKNLRIIMAGDDKQLPPVVSSKEAMGLGLHVTLFERLMKRSREGRGRGGDNQNTKIDHGDSHDYYGISSTLLMKQYRMNECIMEWPSITFYDKLLIADETVAHRLLHQIVPFTSTSPSPPSPSSLLTSPIVIVDTSILPTSSSPLSSLPLSLNDEFSSSESKSNLLEALLVHSAVRELLTMGVRSDHIGVISPYNGQINLLRRIIREEIMVIPPSSSSSPSPPPSSIEISSVDGFQGREKEIIIISMVRSNESGEVGFLSESRRFNVAVTRAKRMVMVIGNLETLKRDKILRKFVEWSEKHMIDEGVGEGEGKYNGEGKVNGEEKSQEKKEKKFPILIKYVEDFDVNMELYHKIQKERETEEREERAKGGGKMSLEEKEKEEKREKKKELASEKKKKQQEKNNPIGGNQSTHSSSSSPSHHSHDNKGEDDDYQDDDSPFSLSSMSTLCTTLITSHLSYLTNLSLPSSPSCPPPHIFPSTLSPAERAMVHEHVDIFNMKRREEEEREKVRVRDNGVDGGVLIVKHESRDGKDGIRSLHLWVEREEKKKKSQNNNNKNKIKNKNEKINLDNSLLNDNEEEEDEEKHHHLNVKGEEEEAHDGIDLSSSPSPSPLTIKTPAPYQKQNQKPTPKPQKDKKPSSSSSPSTSSSSSSSPPSDDFDSIMSEFSSLQSSDLLCPFVNPNTKIRCSTKLNPFNSMESICPHCVKKYCFSHSSAVLHGCGLQARKVIQAAAKSHNGVGMNGDKKKKALDGDILEKRLNDKMEKLKQERTAKKTEGKEGQRQGQGQGGKK